MKYSILKQYMRLCGMYGWEMSWKGLRAYNAQRGIRRKWAK